MRKLLKRVMAAVAVGAVALSIWIAVDIYSPFKVDIRDFDPDEVARLDTVMWRSYYGRERLRMYFQLTELLESQYKFPFWRRQLVAFHAAKAAFVFKEGKTRDEYEKALPDLIKFYEQIRSISTTDFDAKRAAELELEWWIVHRQRKQYGENALAEALAATAGEIYQMPPERFAEHGDLRAKAMEIRDTKAESGGVAEEDWQKIDSLLHLSWRSLHDAVKDN